MKVIIMINDKGKVTNWEELSEDEQKEVTSKLNSQTAKALGYKKATA